MLVWAGETFRKCNGLNELRRCVHWLDWIEWGLELEVAGMPREREGRGKEENREAEKACYGALGNRE